MSHLRISFFVIVFLFFAPVYSSDKPLSSEELAPVVQTIIQTITTNTQSSNMTFRRRTKSTDAQFETIRKYLALSDAAQPKFYDTDIEKLQQQLNRLKADKQIYEKLAEQKSEKK